MGDHSLDENNEGAFGHRACPSATEDYGKVDIAMDKDACKFCLPRARSDDRTALPSVVSER